MYDHYPFYWQLFTIPLRLTACCCQYLLSIHKDLGTEHTQCIKPPCLIEVYFLVGCHLVFHLCIHSTHICRCYLCARHYARCLRYTHTHMHACSHTYIAKDRWNECVLCLCRMYSLSYSIRQEKHSIDNYKCHNC